MQGFGLENGGKNRLGRPRCRWQDNVKMRLLRQCFSTADTGPREVLLQFAILVF